MTAPTYAFAVRALRRWRDERLRMGHTLAGGVQAEFHFEGSTCGNIPFQLVYFVELGPAADEFRIQNLHCEPSPADVGHERMCSFLENAENLLETLRTETPLLGHPIADALTWSPPTQSAGCVCAAASRHHKWLAVLQTLHFTLFESNPGIPL